MRIISGRFKGRIIKRPKGIRPTQDKVRKALFDILGDIQGLSFLDFYAGSGAIGLEALSQGAGKVVFVETNSVCIKKIKENLKVLGASGYRVMRLDALQVLEKLAEGDEKFDIVFMDPPYYRDLAPRTRSALPITGRSGSKVTVSESLAPRTRSALPIAGRSGSKATVSESLAKKTLKTLSRYDIVSPNGLIICQHFKKDSLPEADADLRLIKQAKYGDTLLSFYGLRDKFPGKKEHV